MTCVVRLVDTRTQKITVFFYCLTDTSQILHSYMYMYAISFESQISSSQEMEINDQLQKNSCSLKLHVCKTINF